MARSNPAPEDPLSSLLDTRCVGWIRAVVEPEASMLEASMQHSRVPGVWKPEVLEARYLHDRLTGLLHGHKYGSVYAGLTGKR